MKNQTSLLQAALQYAAEGFRIVPCNTIRNGTCSCSKVCRKPGKHPRINNWPERASCDPTQITKWFSKWPDSNFGVATGTGSGIIAFDFDGDEGHQTLEQLTTDDPTILETHIHHTGGGGAHLIYRHPGFDVANSVRLLPGMDVRGDGGLIILPPSVHVSGVRYAARNSLPIASLPPALLESLGDGGLCCHKESSGVLKGVEEKQSELKQEKEKEEGLSQQMPAVPPEQIEWALKESLPHGPGRRNKHVFQLARHLQAIDGITQQISANAFRRIVARWHHMLFDEAASRGFSVTGDVEETLADFRFAWTRVKYPIGQTLQPVFDKVVQMDSDGEVSPLVWNSLEYFFRTENRAMQLLTAVLYELSVEAGDNAFSLACDAGAFQLRRVGVNEASGQWLYRRLQNLTADQVIACVDPGKSGNQSTRKTAKFVWTHHVGKETRFVPIGDILPWLETEFDRAPEGTHRVFTRFTESNVNLAKPFEKIIEAAGLTVWPKLIQNLRASCETDWLDAGNPAHVVARWIGHSVKVQNDNYAQVDDHHFDQFNANAKNLQIQAAEESEKRATDRTDSLTVAPLARETANIDKPAKLKNPAKHKVLRGSAEGFGNLLLDQVPEAGVEPAHGITHTGF